MEKDTYSNLNRSNKWLGIIDYKSLIILVIYMFFIWNIMRNIFSKSVI